MHIPSPLSKRAPQIKSILKNSKRQDPYNIYNLNPQQKKKVKTFKFNAFIRENKKINNYVRKDKFFYTIKFINHITHTHTKKKLILHV